MDKFQYKISLTATLGLTSLTLVFAPSSLAFNLVNTQGKIEFSANAFGGGVANPVFGNRLPEELLSAGQNYNLLDAPILPIGGNSKPLNALPLNLNDVWIDPRGEAEVTVSSIVLPKLAGISWSDLTLIDNPNDNLAVSNASFGQGTFQTTIAGPYIRYASLGVRGSIDLNKPDAWVMGSLIGQIGEVDNNGNLIDPIPFANLEPIVFGFDGANRPRNDFISLTTNDPNRQDPSTGYSNAVFGANDFSVRGINYYPFKNLNLNDQVRVQGTFTCIAYNGTCEPIVSFNNPDLDFGDAPDSYQTLLQSDGPRYLEGDNQRLGFLWDSETNGQPTPLADGDDKSILGGFPLPVDDEDGVIFGDSWVDVIFNITRPDPNPYQLRAWWDTNYNGIFDHTSELYIDDLLTLEPGVFIKRYDLGFDPKADGLYSRFRLTWDPLDPDVKPFGEYFSNADCNLADAAAGNCISHGEVEDYVHTPEASSTIGILTLGILGGGATLKRKLKSANSTKK